MAFVTFLARRKMVGRDQLGDTLTIGRSYDCDVYVPDVFISRQHCRFEQRDGSWWIVDLQSRNGIWVEGKRCEERVLMPGDIIEIGTVAMCFNAGDAEGDLDAAPYGMGIGVTELMDTVYAQELRPSVYSKRQLKRKRQWRERVKERIAQARDHSVAMPMVEGEAWIREEWAELDLEGQLVAAQAEMQDWEPPIFNPKRRAIAAATKAEVPTPAASVNRKRGEGESFRDLRSGTPVDYGVSGDSIDLEMAARTKATKTTGLSSLSGSSDELFDGVLIEQYTWRDGLKDKVKGLYRDGKSFATRNPQIAVAAALLLVVGLGLAFRYKSNSGPHYYIPENEAKTVASSSY